MRLPSTRARRAPADAGASAIEYALIVAGMIVGLLAVAGGLRSAISTSYASAECDIGSISQCTSPTATGTGTSPTTATTTTPVTPVTTVNASSTSPEWGTPVTLTAQVQPAASGTVYFVEVFASGDVAVGTGTLVNGYATFTVANPTLGNHVYRVLYTGSVSVPESTSVPVTVTVVKRTSTTSLSVNPTSGTVTTNFVLTATVSPGDATGSVTFFEGTTELGSSGLSGGTATLTRQFAPGPHVVTAQYSGDGLTNPSTSNAVTLSVAKINVTVQVSVTGPLVVATGRTVTVNAAVTPGTASGAITFYDNGSPLPPATILAGNASAQISFATPGPHVITASYGGDAGHNPQPNSDSVTVTAYRPPGVVTNVRWTEQNPPRRVEFTWSAPTYLPANTYYVVTRDGIERGTSQVTAYTDPVSNRTAYAYTITACFDVGAVRVCGDPLAVPVTT